MSLGFTLNALVMAFNGGQMPVLWPGGCDAMRAIQDMVTSLGGSSDPLHSCMTHATHLKFLADWIILKSGVASPGDFLEWAYDYTHIPSVAIWVALTIKERL
jgi:hypothetical protein